MGGNNRVVRKSLGDIMCCERSELDTESEAENGTTATMMNNTAIHCHAS